jgi:uncharacterized membrane protein
VIITIMVLAIKIPSTYDAHALYSLWPNFLSYAISYAFVAIVWMNHHFVIRFARKMTPLLAWSNFANLFWIALIPFATAWLAAGKVAPVPVSVYSGVFFMVEGTYIVLMYETFAQDEVANLLKAGSMRLHWMRAWLMFAIFFVSASAWFLPALLRLVLLTSFLVMHFSPGLKKST